MQPRARPSKSQARKMHHAHTPAHPMHEKCKHANATASPSHRKRTARMPQQARVMESAPSTRRAHAPACPNHGKCTARTQHTPHHARVTEIALRARPSISQARKMDYADATACPRHGKCTMLMPRSHRNCIARTPQPQKVHHPARPKHCTMRMHQHAQVTEIARTPRVTENIHANT